MRTRWKFLVANDIKPLNETNLLELYIDGNNLDKAELTAKLFFSQFLESFKCDGQQMGCR